MFYAGGLLFLFNRKAVRFFRKDGHEWRKKADGKTVRETHEKLKVSKTSNVLLVLSGVNQMAGKLWRVL